MTATTELPPEITVIPQAYLLIGVSVGVIFLCLSFLLWRQSSSSKGSKVSAQLTPKQVIEETPLEEVEDDGTKKVTILFGTQTGTAEGFAKVSVLYTNSLPDLTCQARCHLEAAVILLEDEAADYITMITSLL
jgi:hypothetical protein